VLLVRWNEAPWAAGGRSRAGNSVQESHAESHAERPMAGNWCILASKQLSQEGDECRWRVRPASIAPTMAQDSGRYSPKVPKEDSREPHATCGFAARACSAHSMGPLPTIHTSNPRRDSAPACWAKGRCEERERLRPPLGLALRGIEQGGTLQRPFNQVHRLEVHREGSCRGGGPTRRTHRARQARERPWRGS
jgi:hypothetical protein